MSSLKNKSQNNFKTAALNGKRIAKAVLTNKNDFNYKYFVYYVRDDQIRFEIGIWVGKELSIYDHFIEGIDVIDNDEQSVIEEQIKDHKTVIKIVFNLNNDEDVTIKLMNLADLKNHFRYQQSVVIPFEQMIGKTFSDLVSQFEQNKIYILDFNDYYPVIKTYCPNGGDQGYDINPANDLN